MKSPFTGGETKLIKEHRELTFRKEKFSYMAHCYLCIDTGEHFTTTALDTLNINQIYNQYRVKYGIPFPDEIQNIRELYGLSALKMSEILGLGVNQYRLYENGEMPSEAIGKTLKSIMNISVFTAYVHNAENQFDKKEFERINDKIGRLVSKQDDLNKRNSIFCTDSRSVFTGYAKQSYSKVKNVILYYVSQLDGVFNTKMNKLLFYSDFLSYKLHGVGITGLSYVAIQYGPVPEHWNVVYGSIDDIRTEIIAFSSGNSGDKLCSDIQPDMNEFSKEDIVILETVLSEFKDVSANDISAISHKEDAWIKYIDTNCRIDYNEAFSLKAL
jgi:uncharacterized phage-associated protein/transcriptional regulator with XRE-family HTH domain